MSENSYEGKHQMITDTAVVCVTWMDGISETYHGQTRVHDGVLHVYTASPLESDIHIPLANIRYWTKP